MWKYEDIMQRMLDDNRFKVSCILYPYNSFSNEEKDKSIRTIDEYLSHFSVAKYNVWDSNINIQDLLNKIKPELIFYPMPYEGIYGNELEYSCLKNLLTVYYPYGISIQNGGLTYNTPFHNIAWKNYAPTEWHRRRAVQCSDGKGKNTVTSGALLVNNLKEKNFNSPWKSDHPNMKKIIWAPHYSITSGHALYRTGFLWMHEYMSKLAERMADKLQIAFKPHPKLKTMLYQHPDWGKERTDKYYKRWEEGRNTILSEGNYEALFATSDAMIHDSCGFICEYLYTCNPVMFCSKDIEEVRKDNNEFGNNCLDRHYLATSIKDIETFIEKVIFESVDTLKDNREAFYADVLRPHGDLNPAEFIYNDILKEFDWK